MKDEPLAQIEKDFNTYLVETSQEYKSNLNPFDIFKAGAISQNNKLLELLASSASHISDDHYVIPVSYFETLKITDK